MENFYFTFGQNHWTRDGFPMKDSWVRVVANNYEEARELFVQKFTSIYMQALDKFAFQYNEKTFRSQFFPKGEFMVIQ